jgi:CMP-N-acetylneuraminic acid synthetase
MRPSELSGDKSPARDYVSHAFKKMEEADNYKPDLMVMLLPTTPLRETHLVDQAITLLKESPNATGLRSVHELSEPPQKMMAIKDGYLTGFFPDDPRPEYFNLPRQLFSTAYHPNGYVEIVRRDILLDQVTLYGSKILGFITPFSVEIDAPEDFDYLEYVAERNPHPLIKQLGHTMEIRG